MLDVSRKDSVISDLGVGVLFMVDLSQERSLPWLAELLCD